MASLLPPSCQMGPHRASSGFQRAREAPVPGAPPAPPSTGTASAVHGDQRRPRLVLTRLSRAPTARRLCCFERRCQGGGPWRAGQTCRAAAGLLGGALPRSKGSKPTLSKTERFSLLCGSARTLHTGAAWGGSCPAPRFLPTLCEVAALFIGSRLSVGTQASSGVLGILLPDWCSFPLVFILFQRWKLGLRRVGSGGLEPGHIQSPCPVGNQGLLQTLGAGELCDQGWGRGLQREVDWTSRRAAHTPPPGFPGVGSEMWGVGAPLHIHPWCACVPGHTHLHTSTHRSPRPSMTPHPAFAALAPG